MYVYSYFDVFVCMYIDMKNMKYLTCFTHMMNQSNLLQITIGMIICIYTYIYMYVYLFICIYVCIYVYLYTRHELPDLFYTHDESIQFTSDYNRYNYKYIIYSDCRICMIIVISMYMCVCIFICET
jgi:hypothetical protein